MIWMGFSEWIELNIYLLLWLKIIFNLFYIKKKFNKIYKMEFNKFLVYVNK